MEASPPSGNLNNKYESRHFLERIAVKGFIIAFQKLLEGFQLFCVLDVGCSEGYLTQLLVTQFGEEAVHGVDISYAGLKEARYSAVGVHHYVPLCADYHLQTVHLIRSLRGGSCAPNESSRRIAGDSADQPSLCFGHCSPRSDLAAIECCTWCLHAISWQYSRTFAALEQRPNPPTPSVAVPDSPGYETHPVDNGAL